MEKRLPNNCRKKRKSSLFKSWFLCYQAVKEGQILVCFFIKMAISQNMIAWTRTTHEVAVYMHNVQKIYVLHLQV